MKKTEITRIASNRKTEVTIREGEAVPFVITKTVLAREPKLKRTSKFIGVGAGLVRLAYGLATKAIEIAEDAFFEKEMQVDDGGVIKQQHYAVFIDETGYGPTLGVAPVEWKPGCGAHYEIVSVQSKETPTTTMSQPPRHAPDQTEATRQRLAAMMDDVRANPETAEKEIEEVADTMG
jgi:hypothetical protein